MTRLPVFRSLAVFSVIVLLCLCTHPASGAGRTRSVTGTVTDARGNALKGAAVQIENPVNLDIASYLTGNDGRYYFHQLSPDIDYKLTAKYKRWWSKSKTLSKFDSKVEATIGLEVPVE